MTDREDRRPIGVAATAAERSPNGSAAKGTVFDVRDLKVSYGDFVAVKDVSLPITQNEITAFIGPSGCGKSTLLRSIGLCAVLGQAGSVVCARRASMTPLRTFTSMRIHDSLTGGVSLFMAELLRLKALVDAADAGDPERGDPALLWLVDEVLQGTNSEERRVAARRIIRHLLASHAIGAVTTHDLALHEEPALDAASTKVHFREHVDDTADQVLTFDYVLRPGLATSRNALRLLKIVGLEGGGVETVDDENGGG